MATKSARNRPETRLLEGSGPYLLSTGQVPYLPCPMNGFLHPPIVSPITANGPKRWPCFICSYCGFKAFLPREVAAQKVGMPLPSFLAEGFLTFAQDPDQDSAVFSARWSEARRAWRKRPEPDRRSTAGPERYLPCPMNNYMHPPIAVEITRRGEKRWPTIRCLACKYRAFLPKRVRLRGTGSVGLAHDELGTLVILGEEL